MYDPTGQGRMIAFLIPNEDSEKSLQNYIVTVDSLENLTGIDFFPELPDLNENHLESSLNLSSWSFNK